MASRTDVQDECLADGYREGGTDGSHALGSKKTSLISVLEFIRWSAVRKETCAALTSAARCLTPYLHYAVGAVIIVPSIWLKARSFLGPIF